MTTPESITELEVYLAEQSKKNFRYGTTNYVAWIALVLSIISLLI